MKADAFAAVHPFVDLRLVSAGDNYFVTKLNC